MTGRLPSISATITENLKDEFLIFSTSNKMKMGNNLRSLLVWWMGLSLEDKSRFLTKYGIGNRLPRDQKKTNIHVYLHDYDEKKQVKMHVVEVNSSMQRCDITGAMILVSLIRWQMGLNRDSLEAFKEKFYLSGKSNSLEDIQLSAAKKIGVVDSDIEKSKKRVGVR